MVKRVAAGAVKAAGVCGVALLGFMGTIRMTNAASISEYENVVFSVAEDYVNIRDGVGTESTIVGRFYHNSIGEIIGREGDWYQIVSGDVSGFVQGDYVVTGPEAQEVACEARNEYVVVDTEALYLREEPSVNADVLDVAAKGEQYSVLEETQEWVKVAVNGQEGYFYREHVEEESDYREAVSLEEDAKRLHTQVGEEIAGYALQFVGNPYVWGGTSLTNGADCSGFVQAVFGDYGYGVPRTSREQAAGGTSIGQDEVQPGDMVFYERGGTINHVAIYIGNGQVVHASNERNGIKVSDINYRTVARIVRYL